MKDYIKIDEWRIIEEGFLPEYNRVSESIFSIGNGKTGQRANFEEQYSGDSLRGSYVAGVYYPDKTRVGWWKNGYPEYFAKVPNATNWIGLDIKVNGQVLDLADCIVNEFSRVLDMQAGLLLRKFKITMRDRSELMVEACRFCSLETPHLSALEYKITPLNKALQIEVSSYVNGDVKNEDANYDENFWDRISESSQQLDCTVVIRTRKTEYTVATAIRTEWILNNTSQNSDYSNEVKEKYAAVKTLVNVPVNQSFTTRKYAITLSSLDYEPETIHEASLELLAKNAVLGFDNLKNKQKAAWAQRWSEADITIEGDMKAQQAVRYNIFQLYQTYNGQDARLNIGPKGFTGEKYGGSTYWDTEAYCLPFYMSTAGPSVAENLLHYRYKHLPRAIENAEKLGFKNGAALYPMVTMNGEECHNEWEITFEEIHRNGAIAYAIYDFTTYTGNKTYIAKYGLEVLIGIARFWAQRATYSHNLDKYVILGVTGPNEFENNVNNNWYTNKIATWCLDYCRECIDWVKTTHPIDWQRIQNICKFKNTEIEDWKKISVNMHFPYDEKLGIYLQQDGFLDKEQLTVIDLAPSERPITEHWSWDRILRSVFIKQADVLQGIYFFEDQFTVESIRKHFEYYEPRTVHESSLSPCVHSILAARTGNEAKAYEFYLRTSRLDLDDYNNDTRDGLHITSMAGTWLSIVKGFAGMRVIGDTIHFKPFLPGNWEGFSFKVNFRGTILTVKVGKNGTHVEQNGSENVQIEIDNEHVNKKGVVAD